MEIENQVMSMGRYPFDEMIFLLFIYNDKFKFNQLKNDNLSLYNKLKFYEHEDSNDYGDENMILQKRNVYEHGDSNDYSEENVIIQQTNQKELNKLKMVCVDSEFIESFQKYFDKRINDDINFIKLIRTALYKKICKIKKDSNDINTMKTILNKVEQDFEKAENLIQNSIDKNPEMFLLPIISKLTDLIMESSYVDKASSYGSEESSTTSNDLENDQNPVNMDTIESIISFLYLIFKRELDFSIDYKAISKYITAKNKEVVNLHAKIRNENYFCFLVEAFCQTFEQTCQILMDSDGKEDLLNFLDIIKTIVDKKPNNDLKRSNYYENDTILPISYILYMIIVEYRLETEENDFLK